MDYEGLSHAPLFFGAGIALSYVANTFILKPFVNKIQKETYHRKRLNSHKISFPYKKLHFSISIDTITLDYESQKHDNTSLIDKIGPNECWRFGTEKILPIIEEIKQYTNQLKSDKVFKKYWDQGIDKITLDAEQLMIQFWQENYMPTLKKQLQKNKKQTDNDFEITQIPNYANPFDFHLIDSLLRNNQSHIQTIDFLNS